MCFGCGFFFFHLSCLVTFHFLLILILNLLFPFLELLVLLRGLRLALKSCSVLILLFLPSSSHSSCLLSLVHVHVEAHSLSFLIILPVSVPFLNFGMPRLRFSFHWSRIVIPFFPLFFLVTNWIHNVLLTSSYMHTIRFRKNMFGRSGKIPISNQGLSLHLHSNMPLTFLSLSFS